MRILLPAIACVILFTNCKKSNDSVPVPAKDTLNAGWTRYFVGNNADIKDIAFPTLDKGYVCIPWRGIYQSLDSGKTWNLILSTENKTIITMNFLNSQYGYCIGPDLRPKSFGFTTDGGNTWNFKNPPLGGGEDIQFVSPSEGYISNLNGLFKTVDTGNNWSLIKTGAFSAIHFIDQQNGWVSKNGIPYQIYSTNDGGNSWNLKYQHNSDPFVTIHFINSSTGWANSNTRILKTVDGGSTWQNIANRTTGFDIQFLNPNLGYRTEETRIIKSIDGGKNWSTEVSSTGNIFYIELQFLDPDHGWAAGSQGTILRYSKL
jgi:photosystem II stability/assembly factor-like uncharacterized protein